MSIPENKYNLLLKISLAMLAVSVILLFISGYSFYFGGNKSAPPQINSSVVVKTQRDSLQDIYSATIKKMDENFAASWNSADTLSTDLDVKIAAFNNLRNDIAGILKHLGPTADLGIAKQKIIELQIMVNGLRNKNNDVEAENKRLLAMLQQLRQNSTGTIASANTPLPQPASFTTTVLKAGPEKERQEEEPLLTRSLQLFAVAADKKTSASEQAEKFVGSFLLRNAADKKNTELMVIVLQPDGKLVRNSIWESGTFESDEGRKAYSKKLYFDPTDEEKQMNFSLSPERFFKGEYTMQIWYNGNLIAMLKKALS